MSWGPDHWHCRIKRVRRKDNVYLFPHVTAPQWPADRQPHQGCINVLRDVVRRAEHGEVQGVAVAWLDHHGMPWRNQVANGEAMISQMIGMMRLLESELTTRREARTHE